MTDFFTPEQQKRAITKYVEEKFIHMLTDLIPAVWMVYGLTSDEPDGDVHLMARQVIERYHLTEASWGSGVIPSREILEGDDAGLEERISVYSAQSRETEHQLRQDLVMMIGFVYLSTCEAPDKPMHQWALQAMTRHRLTPDHYTEKNPLWIPLNLPDSNQVQ
jgi:hypothetical protein